MKSDRETYIEYLLTKVVTPITKTGEETRLVFVIGRIGTDRIHCIKLNDIRPIYFTQFINKLRDKRLPIPSDPRLEDILKTFSKGW
jgi:hypothetical protein